MSEIKRVYGIEAFVPGSLWVLPELSDEQKENGLQTEGYVPGTVLELVKPDPSRFDVNDTVSVQFRVLFGSVPSWWICDKDGIFSLVMPLTESGVDRVVFTPMVLEETP